MKRIPLKAILSSLMLFNVFLLAVSGAMLYFGQTGLILGIRRSLLLKLHVGVSLLFLLFCALHLFLNFKLYRTELKKLFRYNDKR
ncbi:MAG: DUF4405 domain-containing protein [Oscillospiraceae bacterium]|nr:DUF4405 domain-containing protein [Oscillospiraceae bacterium]